MAEASYADLIDQRRAALRKVPPDLKKANQLLLKAEKLVEQGKVSDEQIKGAHY